MSNELLALFLLDCTANHLNVNNYEVSELFNVACQKIIRFWEGGGDDGAVRYYKLYRTSMRTQRCGFHHKSS